MPQRITSSSRFSSCSTTVSTGSVGQTLKLSGVFGIARLVMLTIQDYPRGDLDFSDLDFRQYAVAIAMIAGGFAMVGIAQALRLLLLIYHQVPL
jgi:hypothetical protein